MQQLRYENKFEYSINVNQTIGGFQKALTIKLLKRIYEVCKKNKIKLIIVDIPSWEINGNIKSSIGDILSELEVPIWDYLIKFDVIRNKIKDNEIVREKGHHHITEKSHRLIAELCADYIKSQLNLHINK